MNGDVAKEKVEKKAEVAQENGDVQKEESGKQMANAEGEAKQENGEVVHVTDWAEQECQLRRKHSHFILTTFWSDL